MSQSIHTLPTDPEQQKEKHLLLDEVAEQIGAHCTALPADVFHFGRNSKGVFLYLNKWPQNPASSSYIAENKFLTGEILTRSGIPTIAQGFVSMGNEKPFEKASALYKQYGESVVLKNNFGSNGVDILFCDHDSDYFEKSLLNFLAKYRSVNISRKIEIVNEFRCVVLDDIVELTYLKKRPVVVGDGATNLLSLLARSHYALLKLKKNLESQLYAVPSTGQVIELSDQDNLSLGAMPEIVHADSPLFPLLKTVAQQAAQTLALKFCSVDIVLESSGQLRVMEINSGVMFDSFAAYSASNRSEVIRIYAKALESALR